VSVGAIRGFTEASRQQEDDADDRDGFGHPEDGHRCKRVRAVEQVGPGLIADHAAPGQDDGDGQPGGEDPEQCRPAGRHHGAHCQHDQNSRSDGRDECADHEGNQDCETERYGQACRRLSRPLVP